MSHHHHDIDHDMMFPDEPATGGWAHQDTIDRFLRWAYLENGASDVKFTPSDPVSISVHGEWWFVTKRIPNSFEIRQLVIHCSGRIDAAARLDGGEQVNYSYELTKKDGDRRSGTVRFRGNATAALGLGGAAITMRSIPEEIPTMDDLNIPMELRDALFDDNGIVSVSGIMGSGKTTSIASVIRHLRVNTRRSVGTLEEPIEFDYTRIPGAKGPIEQMEVPTHVKSFKDGIIALTRKATKVLLVGETNKPESMEAMIHAGEVGSLVYHTLHTPSVASIPSRIFHMFPGDEMGAIAAAYMSSVRVMLQQRLVPRKGGGRVAMREYLIVNETMRQELIQTPIDRTQVVVERMVREEGHSLLKDARQLYERGLIDEITLSAVEKEKN